MSHTTTLRRTASALGATALLGVVLAAPALAIQDPGTGGPAVSSSSTTDDSGVYGLDRAVREGTSTGTTDDSGVYGLPRAEREGTTSGIDRNRQVGGFTMPSEVALPGSVTAPSAPSVTKVVRVDDDAVEYLQVAAGLLAGVAIAAAGAVIVTRRNQGGLTPA